MEKPRLAWKKTCSEFFERFALISKYRHRPEKKPYRLTSTANTDPEQWAAIAAAAGEQLGVWCLAQRHLLVVLRMERALDIHSPHLQSLPALDSNLQPFDYESDSLSIRLRLPPIQVPFLPDIGFQLLKRLWSSLCIYIYIYCLYIYIVFIYIFIYVYIFVCSF